MTRTAEDFRETEGSSDPTPADGGGAAVDLAVLSELIEMIGDFDGGSRALIDTYLDDSGPRVENLRAAVEAGDGVAVARAAHGLRSSSASLGALRLADLLSRTEAMGLSGTGDLGGMATAIEAEYLEVSTALLRVRQAD
jgi:HPt (histidine-containing phosphotransfer) domain-containing protein